jgi:protein-L-isoaspartate(D-aspartate) O-methyltransferase
VSAGVTHPEPEWLSALSPGGSIVLPLTAAFAMPGPAAAALPAMASISKGLLVLLTRGDRSDHFDARVVTFIAIYSAVGLRDEGINVDLGRALSRLPLPPLRAYRLDAHDADATCWCHTTRGCWSTRP